ncbi:hypothetical protein LX36DRAFT_651460 [Colletotrichum falcatum]|nr:hypothetical protein LX36DRAFT_651460 [Colletotrichum falcatum]
MATTCSPNHPDTCFPFHLSCPQSSSPPLRSTSGDMNLEGLTNKVENAFRKAGITANLPCN